MSGGPSQPQATDGFGAAGGSGGALVAGWVCAGVIGARAGAEAAPAPAPDGGVEEPGLAAMLVWRVVGAGAAGPEAWPTVGGSPAAGGVGGRADAPWPEPLPDPVV